MAYGQWSHAGHHILSSVLAVSFRGCYHDNDLSTDGVETIKPVTSEDPQEICVLSHIFPDINNLDADETIKDLCVRVCVCVCACVSHIIRR